MTEVDPADARLALGATGTLGELNRAGVLTAADVHVASRVGRLAGETDERVLLAVALATRAVRTGSVGVDLARVPEIEADVAAEASVDGAAAGPGGAPEGGWPDLTDWLAAVDRSPLVRLGVVRSEFGLLYLDRYHDLEVQLARDLQVRLSRPGPPVDAAVLDAGLERVFPGASYDEQREASRRVAAGWTTVLTGGPGTGKTTTVAGVLALLAEQAAAAGTPMRVALTAPTGKAAARLQEAVATAGGRLSDADQRRLAGLTAVTLHRLLGTRRDNRTRFRHHRGNRLAHDVVVVDESSMVSLTLMTRLVEAVRPDARLLLVGDPDQLASVEAGAVLADLVAGLPGGDPSPTAATGAGPVVQLRTTHRYGAGIAVLAEALRGGSPDEVVAVLRSDLDDVELVETEEPGTALRADLLAAAVELRGLARAGDADGAVAALDGHRLLCAHRDGPFGVQHWNRQVQRWLADEVGDPLYEPMYVGRPLLVTANDYGLGVSNGDAGVVVATHEGPRALLRGSRGVVDFATSRISDVETMYATTIHKAQGSQAREVTVLLPPPESRLLTRELLYTAVTRAQRQVRVVGTEASVRAAVERRAQRASGLRQRLSRPAGADPSR